MNFMITGPITKFNRKYLKRLRPLSDILFASRKKGGESIGENT